MFLISSFFLFRVILEEQVLGMRSPKNRSVQVVLEDFEDEGNEESTLLNHSYFNTSESLLISASPRSEVAMILPDLSISTE